MKTKNLLMLLVATTLITNSFSQNPKLSYIKDSIEVIMKKNDIPGLFITVVTKDSILYKKGIGYADINAKSKVTENHLFRIGSLTKTFTAIAIMTLIKEGKLSLEDELKIIAPEIPFQNSWEDTHPVKIKHLLEHKAGFDDMHIAAATKQRISDMTAFDEVLNYKNSLCSRWKPGLVSSYSNPGYVILGYIIEKISGISYQQYIRKNVLLPLGMHSTQFISENGLAVKEELFSKGYYKNGTINNVKDIRMIGEAAGSLMSNANEMSNFLQYFLNDNIQNAVPSIKYKDVLIMEKGHSWFELKNQIISRNGLGLFVREFGKEKYSFYGHNGVINGFRSDFIYSRQYNLGFAISNNIGVNNKTILNLLVDTFISKDLQKNQCNHNTVNLNRYNSWEGEYRVLNTRNKIFDFLDFPFKTVKVNLENDSLVINRFLGSKVKYISCGSNSFKKPNENKPTIYLSDNEGEKSIYYNGDVLIPVNSIVFLLFRLLLAISLLAPILITILFVIQLIVYFFRRSKKQVLIRTLVVALPYWTIALSIYYFLSNFSLEELDKLGKVSYPSIMIFILTGLFPVISLYAVYLLYKKRGELKNFYVKCFYSYVLFGSLFITGYCMYFDWFALRLWSY